MKMITKLRRLKLLLHLKDLWTWSWEKCSEELLPQSSSDFIYAIIVEEYGLIGGFGVLILYLLLVSICCSLAQSQYALGKLVVVGLGFPMIFKRWYGCSGRVIAGNGTDIAADK
jgi:hypothetical protein